MRYFLDTDGMGQWYLVPDEKRHLWFQYADLLNRSHWHASSVPNWVRPVAWASSVVFENPVVRTDKEINAQLKNPERLALPDEEE